MERIVGWGLSKYVPNPASGISITNVPGPSEPLYLRSARLVRGFAGTFLLDGIGLILAASSYCGELVLQFTSTPNMMPDPAFFVACLREAYEELAAAVS